MTAWVGRTIATTMHPWKVGGGTIRNELEMNEYKTTHDVFKEISPRVRYYNFERKHSAIEYLTPAKFEQLQRRSK